MAKNTNKRGASRGPVRKKTQRQVPGWVWLFTGLMVGLFVAFLFHLGKTQMEQGGNGKVAQTPAVAKAVIPPRTNPSASASQTLAPAPATNAICCRRAASAATKMPTVAGRS